MSIKHLFRTVALVTAFSIATRILGFGFRIFLSRELGAEMLGFYSIALAFFGVLCSFVSSGIPVCVSKRTSEIIAKKEDSKKIGGVLVSAIVLSTVLAAVSFIFVLILKPLISSPGEIVFALVLILVPAVLFSGIYSAVRGTMWGHKNFFGVCITELIEQIIRIGLCVVFFLFLPQFNKVVSAAVSLAVSVVIAAVVTIIYYLKSGKGFSSGRGHYKDLIKASMPITAVRFTGSFLHPVISLIIPFRLVSAGYTKSQAVASLGVSMGMVFPLLFLPGTIVGSLAMALVPDISGSLARGEHENLLKRVKSSLIFTIVVASLFIPLFVAVGKEIGIILFNNIESGELLAKGAVVMIPMSLSNISSTILNSLGLEVKSMRNYLIGSVFLFLSIWFLPAIVGGGMALITGMGISSLIISILNIKMIEKKLNKKISYAKDALVLIIFAFICGFLGRNIYALVSRVLPMFISSVAGGCVAWFCFFTLLSLFKFVSTQSIFAMLKRRKVAKIKMLL